MFKLFFGAGLLCLNISFSFTDNFNQIDSVLLEAEKYRTSAPDKSSELLSLLTESQLDKNQLALFKFLKAFESLMKGQTQSGIEQLEVLVNTTHSDNIKTRSLAALLNTYAGLHEWNEAFNTIKNLELSLQKINNPEVRNYASTSMLSFYNNIDEFKLAKHKADEILQSTLSERSKCLVMGKKLYAQLQLSDTTLTENNFHDASVLCQSINELILQHGVNSNWAKFYLTENQPQKAITLLLDNLDNLKSQNFDSLTAYFIALLVEAYVQSSDWNNAAQYSKEIIENYSAEDFYYPHEVAYKTLYQFYQKENDYKNALDNFDKYKTLEKRDYDDKVSGKMAIEKARIERSHELALLNKENNLLMTQAELVAQRSQNTQLLLTGAVLLLGLAIIWLIKSRITHKMLRKIAQTDELTGICNRHYFTSQAEASLRYCQKVHQQVSFIVLDLDHFKQVNDKYGHQTGDWALKQAVLAVQRVCRANDIIGRLGGEEFAILLPSCGVEKACQLAESCREAIAQIDTQPSGHQFRLTASFGISHNTQAGYDLDKLFAYADKALYSSKDSGRNKIYTYQEGNELPA